MSEYPSHWINCQLGERIRFEYGKSPNEVRCSDGKYPVYGSSGKTALAINYTTESPAIIVGRKGTIDKPIFLQERCWAIDTTFFTDKFPSDDPKYLFYLLDSINLRSLNESTGVPSLSRDALHSIPVSLPPLPEQKKIAEILSGIDKLIAITNSRMISEKHLRVGLLEEMISEKRTFLKLDSVTTRVSGHTPSKSNSGYWNGGIPWISLSDTAKLDKRYISDTAKEISEQGIQNSSAVLHPAGLVVLSRDARVGCSAITTKKMAVSQHFIGWICSGQILNRYLYYVLQKWKHKFEAIAMGSTIPTIGVPFFRDLEIPVPSTSEQQKIADTIESVDCHIEELSQRIFSLQNLKSAISSDLLSGRKRVSI